MKPSERYEEVVVLGGVLAPALLLAIPFLTAVFHIAFALLSCVALLVMTVVGAAWFRRRRGAWRSIQVWRLVSALLLSTSFLFLSAIIGDVVGGIWFALCVVVLAVGIAVGAHAWSRHPRPPSGPVAIDSRLIGRLSAVGAVVGSILLALLGRSSVALLVCVLHMTLAVVTGLVAMHSYRELRCNEVAH